jgi:hypothetical protein
MSLKEMSNYPPEKITRLEWRSVGDTLKKAKEMLEAKGCRHSWIDGALAICEERGKEPI